MSFIQFYKKKLKKALSNFSTWVTITIVLFIFLFNEKRNGAVLFSDYAKIILMYGITFMLVHFLMIYVIWRLKEKGKTK